MVGTVKEAFPGRMFSISVAVSTTDDDDPAAESAASALLVALSAATLLFLLSEEKSMTGTTAFGEGSPLVPRTNWNNDKNEREIKRIKKNTAK